MDLDSISILLLALTKKFRNNISIMKLKIYSLNGQDFNLFIPLFFFFFFFFSVEKIFHQNDLLTCILKAISSELREYGTDFFEVNVAVHPLL